VRVIKEHAEYPKAVNNNSMLRWKHYMLLLNMKLPYRTTVPPSHPLHMLRSSAWSSCTYGNGGLDLDRHARFEQQFDDQSQHGLLAGPGLWFQRNGATRARTSSSERN